MDWGKFSFEYQLELTGANFLQQIVNIEAYKEASLNLVLPPDWRDQLNRLNRARQVHGTTALEGSPLSESDVLQQIDILEGHPNARDSNAPATKIHEQTRNAVIAQTWVRN